MTDTGVPPDSDTTAVAVPTVALTVDGVEVMADPNRTLLDVLRINGFVSVKDGCSPQGQCGCCTVLVDGAPRVACVTPVRRMKGKAITTVDGLDAERRNLWAEAFTASGASQCGFCTPGIICRLEGAAMKGADLSDRAVVDKALLAHLCRCTGWQTIREAATNVASGLEQSKRQPLDNEGAAHRASIEGGAPQRVGPEIALGRGGFAADTAPIDALVAVPDGDGWFVAADLDAARLGAGKIQGRRSTVQAQPPLTVPKGEWVYTLRTCWTEPAYLETDVVWCEPGGEPVGPLLNGGAFGAKSTDLLRDVAKRLASEHDRCVKVVYDREDVVVRGPKRPPVALGIDSAGNIAMVMAETSGGFDLAASIASDLGLAITTLELDIPGPPTSVLVRAALRAEIEMVRAALNDHTDYSATSAASHRVHIGEAWAEATVARDSVAVRVSGGAVLDQTVMRSYVIGAVHQALGFVRSESIAVDSEGRVHDLTVRSFGILRSVDTPEIDVEIVNSDGDPQPVSPAVFCAVAAAAWCFAGKSPILPLTAN